ncbi:hypothetical protein B0H11DRAFT_1279160 [Mycena galericulata]|nr:hypothetical protein B0H11DRAFT_1279160 [Mycena galericulata]
MSGDVEQSIPASDAAADNHDESEASCAKIWSVYVSEAEKYDKALVESWRGDMDGMLIFAGLFSASLTAFIIESYKTLTPDSGDTTAALLAQISKQLAASASGTSFEVPAPAVFVIPVTSVICNTLWFISLGLSLACAMIATLVEQWARDFVQKAEMRPSPVIRARIFSYLYYGLKRFNMHVLVDLVPLLLHMSLVLFFAGLVAFLLPINHTVMAVAAALLCILVAVYCILTILPLVYFDCPYRTPLSMVLWRIRQLWLLMSSSLARMRHGRNQEPPGNTRDATMVEVMISRATQPSAERDQRALCWMMKSLTDDAELHPFIDGIPDMLWGPDGRRRQHDHLIHTLLNDPDVRLGDRILILMRHSDSGLLPHDIKLTYKVACIKALWNICTLAERGAPLNLPIHPLARQLAEWASSSSDRDTSRELRDYIAVGQAALDWCILCSFDSLIQGCKGNLERCLSDAAAGQVFAFDTLRIGLDRLLEDARAFSISYFSGLEFYRWQNDLLIDEDVASQLNASVSPSLSEAMPWFQNVGTFLHESENCWDTARHTILHAFLSRSQSFHQPDERNTIYAFDATFQMLRTQLTPPSAPRMETYLDLVEKMKKDSRGRHDAYVLVVVLPFLFPVAGSSRPPIYLDTTDTLISIFAVHLSLKTATLFQAFDEPINWAHLWAAVIEYLDAGCPLSNNIETTLEVMSGLYHFLNLGEQFGPAATDHGDGSILSILQSLPVCSPLPSVLVVIKSELLLSIMSRHAITSRRLGVDQWEPPSLPAESLTAEILAVSMERLVGPYKFATPSDWDEYKSLLSHPLLSETRLDSAAAEDYPDFDFDFQACDDDAERTTRFTRLWADVAHGCIDAVAILSAEFIEACSSPTLPYLALETLDRIPRGHSVFLAHAPIRTRFANSIHALMKARTLSPDHAKIWEHLVLESPILEESFQRAQPFMRLIYTHNAKYDPSAILVIKNALEEYADSMRGSATPLETRVKELLKDWETLLPQADGAISAGGEGSPPLSNGASQGNPVAPRSLFKSVGKYRSSSPRIMIQSGFSGQPRRGGNTYSPVQNSSLWRERFFLPFWYIFDRFK